MGIIINVIAIVCVFITIVVFVKEMGENKEESDMPTFATSIGVLGTFLGITVGLLGFDVTNIDASVPALLEGMKTAFLTSIWGMVASIGMKVFMNYKSKKQRKGESNLDYSDGIEVTKALVEEIKELNKTNIESQNNLKELFQELKNTNDTNLRELVEQMKLSRVDLVEGMKSLKVDLIGKNDELIKEFKDFSIKMADMNSKSLIEALNDVIKDFNNNLTEQFGQNFKELNVAVGELLKWQDNYKSHIEVSTENLDNIIESLNLIKGSYVEIVERSKEFDNISRILEVTLGEAAVTNENLAIATKSLVDISSEAVDVVPNIKEGFEAFRKYSIEIMNEGKKTSNQYVKDTLEVLEKNNDIHREAAKEIIENSSYIVEEQFREYTNKFSHLLDELRGAIPEINNEIVRTNEKFNSALELFKEEVGNVIRASVESVKSQVLSIEKANATLSKSVVDNCDMIENTTRKATTEIESSIKGLVENSNKAINDRISKLEENLENELNTALKSLGTNLVQISRKFAEDYTPLAEKLKEVVNIVKDV